MSNANDYTYGEDWLRACGKTVSEKGARCANLINWWLRGIYHAQDDVLRADWSGEYVRMTIYARGGYATFDGDNLTRLVVGAHDHGIRVDLTPCNPSYIRLLLHPRSRRHGHMFERHPNIDTAIGRMDRAYIYEDVPDEMPA